MPRTQQILAAVGDPDGFALLEVLRRGPQKQSRLAVDAGVAGGTASARIDVLIALGVIGRSSARGELSISFPDDFAAMMDAADSFTGVLLAAEVEEHERRREEEHGGPEEGE